jgi:predicted DNA-binding transcriptional regulator AlpA
MKTFEFSIIASGLNPADDDFEARFFDNGCDDATVSFQKGHIIVEFAREAQSVDKAISSAIEGVLSAGAIVERVEPDPLVSLADIAARTGMSRAAMTNYSQGKRQEGFPAPAVKITSDSPLWDWSEVADWLFKHDKLSRDEAVEAVAVAKANEVIRSGAKDIAEQLHQRVLAYEMELAA